MHSPICYTRDTMAGCQQPTEDLNTFLMKIKVDAGRRDVDRTTLPKRVHRAKYENITMASEGFQVSENIEPPMRQPSVPLQEGENTLEIWRLSISTPNQPDSGKKRALLDDTTTSLPSSGPKQNSPMETEFPTGDLPLETYVPVGGDLPLETDSHVVTEFPMETDLRMDSEDLPQSPLQILSSVEKLRAALQTPSTGSQEGIFGNKLGLRKPALFAPLNTGGSSKRSMSAFHGGSLSYDSEGEPPTSGNSKRSRHRSVKGVGRSVSRISGELPELNFLPCRVSDKSDMTGYFASGDSQAGILAQSQLLEDTSGSTQKPMPADSINTTTIILAK